MRNSGRLLHCHEPVQAPCFLGYARQPNTNNWYQTYRVIGLGMSDGWWIQNGVRPNTAGFPALVSESLTWEKVYNWNFGLDFAFLNNRLRGSMDYFIRNTKNMVVRLLSFPQPSVQECPRPTTAICAPMAGTSKSPGTTGLHGDSATAHVSCFQMHSPQSPATPTIPRIHSLRIIQTIQNVISRVAIPGKSRGYETVGIAKTQAEMDAHLKNNMPSFGDNWKAR